MTVGATTTADLSRTRAVRYCAITKSFFSLKCGPCSFDSAPIAFETHRRWFDDSLQRPDRHLFIVLADGHETGVVRLDVAEAAGTVSIHLAPAWRGRGVGPSALAALERIAFGALGLARMEARVKADNAASLAAFRKAGFVAVVAKPPVSLVKVRREG